MGSYVDQIKASNPTAYQQLQDLGSFTANEFFGGQLQDYQAQLLTPLDTSKVGAAKQIDVSQDGTGQYVPNNWGGYQDTVPTILNGVPVYAQYDAQGNIGGYTGDPSYRTWLNGQQSVSGAWDANGNAIPIQYTSGGGGIFSGITSGLSDFLNSDLGKLALIGGAAYAGGLFDPISLAASGSAADASFVAADASQLAAQGLSQAQIASTLEASGVDSFIAADAAQLASQGIEGSQLESLLTQSAGGTSIFAPAVAGAAATGLGAADVAAAEIGSAGSAGSAGSGLTTSQVAALAKAGLPLAGLLGGTAALGNLVGGSTGSVSLPVQDRSGVSSGSAQYSPEYYQAIQAKYNQMMPQQPRDVTTELKNWYETKYAPTATITPTPKVA